MTRYNEEENELTRRFSKRYRKREKGFRDISQLRKWEEYHDKIIQVLFRRGGLVKMGYLVEETGIPRQTILRHLDSLQKEGRVKMEGKSGWMVLEKVYLRSKPEDIIKNILGYGGFAMSGHPDLSQITIIESPRRFLSPEQVTKLQNVISSGVNNGLKGLPERVMISVVINTALLQSSE